MSENKIKQDQHGFYYFDELPGSFVKATPEDFYQHIQVLDEEGNFLHFKLALKLNHAFLIHSFHFPLYWAYRIKPEFDTDKLDPWFKEGRVFIFKSTFSN